MISVKEVKQKWKKLRDSYRDALKRASETASRGVSEGGGSGKRAYPWKYMSRMQFLQPYMGNRKKAGESPPPAPPPRADSSSDSEEPEPAPRRRRRASPAPARDPLDTFFEGMCQTTRRLPLHTQLAIKKSLFACVVSAEEAQLAERQQQSYAALWPRAPRRPRAPSSSGSDAPPS